MTTAKDGQGNVFKVGQRVARADKQYRTDGLYVKVCSVTKVNGNKVYLDGSPQALKYPGRVIIL